jgi:hypothetical protein
VIGLFVLGLSTAPTNVNCLPYVFLNTQVKYKIVDKVDEALDGYIADQQASLFGIFFSGTCFFAPLIGAALYDNLGYRHTFDIIQFTMYGLALYYLIFVAGFSPFKKYKAMLEE